jgi:hypothetical protein
MVPKTLTYVNFSEILPDKKDRDYFFNQEISRGHFPFPGNGNAHSLVRWTQLQRLLREFTYVHPGSTQTLIDMEN